jgi:Enoyl-CoA hydratase/isomerase
VAVVRLRHGRVNALDLELLQALTAAMREVDPTTAVVITGTGTAFSAGVDLQRILAGGPSYVQEFLPALSAAFMAVFDRPGPLLAAINGISLAVSGSPSGRRPRPGHRPLARPGHGAAAGRAPASVSSVHDWLARSPSGSKPGWPGRAVLVRDKEARHGMA